jgi:magnesium transporter
MLHAYAAAPAGQRPAAKPVWIDLLQPTAAEEERVAAEFGIRVPTRAQLEEIESSSRLRVDGQTLYLSMPLAAQNEQTPVPLPLGFVLSPLVLITVRYSEIRCFAAVANQMSSSTPQGGSAAVFASLIEGIVDFAADTLEQIGADLSGLSRRVFANHDQARRPPRPDRLLREMLNVVGGAGEQLSRIRESVLGLQRIIGFASETAAEWLRPEVRTRLKTARDDLASLADFETHLAGKTQFLLDAALGFINTQQNDTFRVLTIVSVVGVPPTLIASMYGMNFHNMPELAWRWGYAYGLALIALSTLLPILWFKRRGWW